MAGTLTNTSVTASDSSPGVKATYTFTFTTETALSVAANDQVFYVQFPTGFYTVDDPAVNELNICQKLTVKVNGVTKTCADSSAWSNLRWIRITEDVAAGSNVEVTLTDITNATSEGNYNFGFLRTSTGGGTAIDDWGSTETTTVVSSGPVTVSTSVTSCTESPSGTFSGASCNVNNTDIANYLSAGTDVTIEANGNLSIESNISKVGGGASTLTLKSTSRVFVDYTISSDTGNPLNVIIWSDSNNSNDAGISLGGTSRAIITAAGGHIWIGGSNSSNGTSTWNGLTVGDGPSIGSSASNYNAIDLINFDINTQGGDLLIWTGDGNTGGGGQSGMTITGSNFNSLSTGSGDLTLIADQVTGSGANAMEVYSTGVFTLLPNTPTTALGWQHTELARADFNNTQFNYLAINDHANLTGVQLGDYTGMSGVTFNYAGDITLSNSVKAAGPITITGSTITSAAAGTITSSNTGDIFLHSTSSVNAGMSLSGAISKTGGATSTLTIKAAGRIYQNTSISSVSGTPLNVVLWSDHDDGNEGGVSVLGNITTYGGDVWIGGSTDGGATSSTWNGLTVGDGPSIGASGANANALDFYASITTDGGDVLLWAGNGVDNTATRNGIQVDNSIFTQITAGSGDVTLIADYILDGAATGNNSVGINSTGHFTLMPHSSGAALGWSHDELASHNFGGNYNYLYIADFANLTGVTLGDYTGMSGVTFNYQGAVTLSNSINVSGPVSVYGGSINQGASGAITATNGNIILDADVGSDLAIGTVAMTISANVTTVNSGDISMIARGPSDVNQNAMSFGAVTVSSAGTLTVETISPATNGGRGINTGSTSFSAAGDISLIGSSGKSGVWDINFANSSITSTAGNITLTAAGEQSSDEFTIQGTNSISTGSGNITINGDRFYVNGNTTTISTPGLLIIQPTHAGFDTDADGVYGEPTQDLFTWSGSGSPTVTVGGTLANFVLQNANTMTGVIIGKSTNESGIAIAGDTNLGGSLTVYGGTINQTGTVTTGNNVNYVVNKTNHTDDYDAITISGALDAGSSDISMVTQSGDIVINADLTTTSTSSTAIVLNAGDLNAAGDTGGGDVVYLSGNLSTGSGGNINIYTGSYFDSFGVSTFVDGNGDSYFNSDGTGLTLNSDINVIYRESAKPFPKALDFDGVNDYVNVTNSNWGDITSAVTIEGWLKFNDTTATEILTRHNSSAAVVALKWGLRHRDNAMQVHVSSGSNHYRCNSTTNPADDGSWHHVAGVFESGVGIRIFIDGVEETLVSCVTVGSGLNLILDNTGSNVRIGSYNDGAGGVQFFNGAMDELRVWNTARTAEEIRENMARNISGNTTGLVAYYNFEHNSGTTLVDVSVNSHSGTLVNMDDADWVDTSTFNTWLGNSADWNDATNWSLGRAPLWSDHIAITDASVTAPTISANTADAVNALLFDGVDDHITAATYPITNHTNFTLEAWVKSSDSGIEKDIIGLGDADGVTHVQFRFNGGYLAPYLRDTVNTASFSGVATTYVADGNWHHVALVKSGQTFTTYVDGNEDATQTFSMDFTNLDTFTIGGMNWNSSAPVWFFNGEIDDVRVWEDARTAEEIRASMRTTLTGAETDLKAYYKLDETSGTAAADASGNASSATLNGTTFDATSTVSPVMSTTGVEGLSIATGASPTLNSSMTINGSLILNANLDLNGQVVTLGQTATLFEDTGSIVDGVESGSITTTRPLSNLSAENVAGLGAVITTAADMGSTTITRQHVALSDPVSIKRQYNITPTTNTGLNATFAFGYVDAELNGLSEQQLSLFKSIDAGSTWAEQPGAIVDTTANTLTLSGLDGFSVWTASIDPGIDTDEDGVPDITDTDDDNDGLSDADEQTNGTNPLIADTDGDGVSDGDEVANGTNPLNAPPIIAQTSPLTITIDEDESPIAWVAPSVNASDLDADTLTWSLVAGGLQGLHGSVTVSGTGDSPTTLDYIPDADYYGVDYFEIQVTDGKETDVLMIKVIVNAQPEPGDPAEGGATAINNFVPYTVGGQAVYDYEGSSDPTNGGASVQPTSIDISSCSADGATPGPMPSTWIKYEDTDTNLNTTNDAYLVMRMRLDANPSEAGRNGPGLKSSHWNFMIDIENDGNNDYIIDIDGTFASSKLDRVWLYQDSNSNNVIDDGVAIMEYIAAGTNATDAEKATSIITITEDQSVICGTSHDFFLDVRIPVDDFPDAFANYDANVGIGVFYSSSASNTDPLQKDWQGFRDVPPDTFEAVNGGFAAPVGSIAGTVFIDTNGDNVYQSSTENPHSSQVVEIFKEDGSQLVSGTDYIFVDNGDSYSITGLAAGNYRMRNASAAGYTQTTKNVTVLGAATAAIDIPIRAQSKVTVLVYEDLDGDGQYDSSETVVDGADITLDAVNAGTTAGGGLLEIDFTAKSAGVYTISNTVLPVGYVPNSATNITINYSVGSNISVAFGVVKQGEIAGVVYFDKDGDSSKDGSESGLSGVTVTLTNEAQVTLNTTTTAADGSYRFTGLSPNTKYYVSETNPTGYASTTADIVPTSFGSGSSSIINFGDVPVSKISGFVFSDDNGNARVDDGEQGLPFVTISIYHNGTSSIVYNSVTYNPGDIVTAVRTNAEGYYSVTLPEGRYRVEETDPLGYVSVSVNSINVTLPSTQSVANFADMKRGVVTGLVFNDLNANGKFDAGEPGVNGVDMTVTPGSVVNTTQGDGSFYYGNLADGDYSLAITVPTGFVATTAESLSVTVSDTNVNTGLLFGIKVSGTIDGEVYHDINGNFRRDASESGIGGVTITLDGGVTTTSLVNGLYSFTGLTANQTYSVVETDPTHYISTTTNSVSVSLDANGKADQSAIFGDQFQGIVAGTVFEDIDANGEQDAQEQTLPGVTMSLTGFSDVLTSNNGSFEFVRVSGSGLTLNTSVPSGYFVTTNNNPETIDMSAYDGSSNIGLQPDATVLAYVFSDANGNGVQDGEELPLSGVTVSMTSGEIGQTDSNGIIRLNGLTPGLNTVNVSAFAGYTDTTPASIALYAEAGQTTSVRFGKLINIAPWARPETVSIDENTVTSTSVVTVVSGDDNGDALTYSIISGNDAGKFSINSTTGEITLIGALDYETTTSYTLTVQVDDGSLTGTADIIINVTDINEAPVANPQTLTTGEDTPLNITLTGTDPENDTLTYTLVSAPTNGGLSGTAPNLIYTPSADYIGNDSFTFTVTDIATNTSLAATITITVTDVNDLPVATPQNISTLEETPIAITLSGTDSDGTIASYTQVTSPSGGLLTGTLPNLTYTPNVNFFGNDSFTFTVTDDDGGVSSAATVTITVNNVNDAPTAVNDTATVAEDSTNNTIAVLVNDSDPDNDVLSVISASASSGQVSINTNGTLSFTPAANFSGTVTITYTISDGNGGTSTATVTVTVTDVNDIPVATPQSLSVDEDNPLTITLSGTDDDGTVVSYTQATNPTNGVLTGDIPNLTYTPASNFFGEDSFTFTVTDDQGAISLEGTISITVNPVNDVPVATDDTTSTQEETPVVIDILSNDVDPEGKLIPSSVVIIKEPSHGDITISPTSGTVTYTPDLNFNGEDTLSYQVSDNENAITNIANVTIEVINVNDAPEAVSDVATTNEEMPVEINLLANDLDVDGDTLDVNSLVITKAPAHGEINVVDGVLTYTPEIDYVGNDELQYKVADEHGLISNIATVYITVIGVNDAPVAQDDSATTDEDTPVEIDILANDTDTEDGTPDPTKVQIIKHPEHGQLSIDPVTGLVTYTPEKDYQGMDSFVYLVDDTGNLSPVEPPLHSNQATVTINVTPLNDAPIANKDKIVLEETNLPVVINILGNDTDVDGSIDVSTVSIITEPEFGTLAINSVTGVVEYTPAADYNGYDEFTYQVKDDQGAISNIATVVLSITPINDPPVAYDQLINLDEDSSVNVILIGYDVEGSPLTFSISQQSVNGQLSGLAPTLVYTPDPGFAGKDTITFVVSDGELDSNEATITLNVAAINDAPVAEAMVLTVDEDKELPITLQGRDEDGDELTYELMSQPLHGTLTGSGANWIYTPDPNYSGPDNFSYRVNDGKLDSATVTVEIMVIPVDEPINAVDDEYEMPAGVTTTLDVLTNDIEPDGNLLTLVSASSSSGSVEIVGGELVYTPADGFTGTVIIEYLVSNDAGGFDTATVTVTVTGGENGPTVTPPGTVYIDAVALYTKVDLGVAAAADRFGNPLPVSLVNDSTFFEPGVNHALWQATDEEGNTTTAEQLVYVRPLISLSKDQTVLEGENVVIGVYLNGLSPTYPLEVPYTVSGTSDSSDHTLMSGIATITDGSETTIKVSIYDDNIDEDDETLIVSLAGDINMGNKREHVVTITEGNIAPEVSLLMTQNQRDRLTISKDEGDAVIFSSVYDPNVDDNHSYDWAVTRGNVTDIDIDEATFTIDPSQMEEGLYVVQLTVTDDGLPALSQVVDIYFEVIESLPMLSNIDSDGDLIPDDMEGFGDSDEDGIPDYLDSRDECNVLLEQGSEQDAFMVEGDPGVCLRVGLFAYRGELQGAQLSDSDIAQPDDELVPDPEASHVGGIFDFIARGLPDFGQSYQIILPQREIIPDNAVYRKFSTMKEWFTFIEDEKNLIHSASGERGFCPPPGGDIWEPGLIAGYWCVQLTIEDGGPNDEDRQANGTIVDPGGVAVLLSENQPPIAIDDAIVMIQGNSVGIQVMANDSDPDGDIIRVLSASASFGNVVIEENGTLTYSPVNNYIGNDIIVYSISDGHGGTDTAQVAITIERAVSKSDDIVTKGGGALTLYWLLLLILISGLKRKVRT
ncbi:Ig-like domain-containing protein [Thalassotalea sp. G2M2-11]|uniref:tandem-95 repeat protein n=1 Tax=Thalassotalea sp. G2M2-11 TaxID=2787627 RepID=UPI0019D20E40|nr:Ig-like domain-containing protein [Thalassotalea sp. G2M2-11]